MNDQWKCTVCDKPKSELKEKKSRVLPGITLYACQDCVANKMEPREYVILAGRQYGADHISFWVKPQRYMGDPITLRELT